MAQFDHVSVIKKANVYFDGKCISHTVICPHDVRTTLGVILPSSLTFNTSAPEVMEGVGGVCRVRLKGETEWKQYGEGEFFKIPGDSSFDIEVAPGEAYHYVCHFG